MPTILRAATTIRCILLGLVLALAWATVSSAQSTFEGQAEVTEVSVPVIVTTRDGMPIRDLNAEDFTVFDDGTEQTVSGFRVVDLDELVPEDGRVRPLEQAMPSAARRHFLLLFDLSFSNNSSVTRSREAAREFVLNQLHPTDLVAVATFSMEFGVRMLVTFTPDRAQLARAIDVVGSRQLRNVNVDPLRFIVSNRNLPSTAPDSSNQTGNTAAGLAALPGNDPLTQARAVITERMERSERSFQRGEITAWSRTMADLAKALNSVKGRKQVLYFSEGFDSRLFLGQQQDGNEVNTAGAGTLDIMRGRYSMVDSDQIFGNTRLQADINEMLREFRRADCVVQAVDIGGLRAGGDVRSSIGDSGREALFYMANETGGELFDNANNLETQLTRMVQRSTVTYMLSFQPTELVDDGSYHRLKVKVDAQRGARVSHRTGYYAPRPFQELHPLEKQLLASDAIASAVPRQDLSVDLLAVPFMANESMAYVPVILEVSGDSLLVEHDEGRLDVEIYTYVTNEKGEVHDFFSDSVTLDLSQNRKAVRNGGLKYYGHLDLAEGEYLVRVLVRNAQTGRAGVRTQAVEVRSLDRVADSHLLQPLFLDEPGRWVLVKEAQRESRQQTVVYPFTVKGEPYIPSARPTLRKRQRADLCLVAYNLGDGELEVSGRILDGEGNEVQGGELQLVERTATGIDGLDKLLATFHPAGLNKGDYTLEVAVRDSPDGMLQTNSIPFSVLN